MAPQREEHVARPRGTVSYGKGSWPGPRAVDGGSPHENNGVRFRFEATRTQPLSASSRPVSTRARGLDLPAQFPYCASS